MCYHLIQKLNIKIHILIKLEAYFTSSDHLTRKIRYAWPIFEKSLPYYKPSDLLL